MCTKLYACPFKEHVPSRSPFLHGVQNSLTGSNVENDTPIQIFSFNLLRYNLYTVKFTNFSMQFCEFWQSNGHDHNQDMEQFHYPKHYLMSLCGQSLLQLLVVVVVVTKSCLTLGNPMDCSPPGSSIHGIFQARILEWIAISFSRGFSWLKKWTPVSCIAHP